MADSGDVSGNKTGISPGPSGEQKIGDIETMEPTDVDTTALIIMIVIIVSINDNINNNNNSNTTTTTITTK